VKESTMSNRWAFEVFENGVVVAEGDAPDREAALAQAGHYVAMYGQDGGEVKAVVREITAAEEIAMALSDLIETARHARLDMAAHFLELALLEVRKAKRDAPGAAANDSERGTGE
jgi:hypothetical protein